MSLKLSVRGAAPRVRIVPSAASRVDAADAVELASRYGLPPDAWQADVLEDWLGRCGTGGWAAGTCGLAVPRQNGKNGVLEMRELFGTVLLGERFLHTAHEVKTARRAFLRIVSFFENEREFPELAALCKEVRRTNGQEAILLTNGGGVEFIARSKGSGRGFTVDVLVCDEAQDLTFDELAALLPTISAAPLGNPQVLLTGTPPDPARGELGAVFRNMRAEAESGRDKRIAWTDFGAAEGPLPDVDDRDLYWVHNPALEIRVGMAEVERERSLMSAETFARERLGWWGRPEGAASVFDMAQWMRLEDTTVGQPSRVVLVVDVPVDQKYASIGVAGDADLERVLVMCVRQQGTAWVADVINDLVNQRDIAEVCLTPGAARGLGPDLVQANIVFRKLSATDVAASCSAIQEAVKTGRICHVGQDELTAAVAGAQTRRMGDGETWDRSEEQTDVSSLVACAAAAYAWGLQDSPLPAIY